MQRAATKKPGMKEVEIGAKEIQVPQNWDLQSLNQIATIKSGKTNSQDSVEDGQYPLFDRSTKIKESDKFLFDTSAVILPGEGREFVPKFYSGKFDLHQRAYSISPEDRSSVFPKFLYYFLSQFKYLFSEIAVGSTVDSLRKSHLKNLDILLPPLSEQKKIAEVLSTVDEAIEKTDEIIETTQELKRGLMQDLLTKGIGHDEFKEANLNLKQVEIPTKWEVEKFGEIFQKRSETVGGAKKMKYVGLEHLESGKTEISGYKKNGKEKSSTRVFREGDVLYGKLRPYLDKAAVAPFDGICSSDIIPIYATDRSSESYLKFLIHHKIVYDRAVSTQEGTNLPRTSWSSLATSDIALPLLSEQKKIAEILSAVDEKIQKEKEYKETLEDLKKGLMQDLLTGRVRVTNLIDE